MSSAEPWQTAEVSGPKKATVITKPAMVRAVINHARHPLLIIGNRAASIDIGEKKFVDYLIDLARVHKIPVIATGHVNKSLRTGGTQTQLLCRQSKPASVLRIRCGMGYMEKALVILPCLPAYRILWNGHFFPVSSMQPPIQRASRSITRTSQTRLGRLQTSRLKTGRKILQPSLQRSLWRDLQMFEDIPADIGLVHVGERIRKNDMFVELGGPSVQEKFESGPRYQNLKRSMTIKSP